MRNFALVLGTYQMTLTEDQWDSINKALENDDLSDEFDQAISPDITYWTLDMSPYLIVDVQPECEDDIPGILNEFEQQIVEFFGE